MEYNLGNLRIFPYKDIQELDNFYCGITEMDKFIHNSNGFTMSIDNHYCKAFVVKDESSNIVAVFALNFDAISFDSDNIDDIFSGALGSTPNIDFEYNEIFISKVHHPALEITYLAVREDKQRQGIGEYLIEEIASAAQKQPFAGCEFLTVSAYHCDNYTAVNFYSKCLFSKLDISRDTQTTTRMFRMLYPKQNTEDIEETEEDLPQS